MGKMKNKKLKAILSLSGYLLLLLALCFTGGLIFHSYYYTSIYVSGTSMMPTLLGVQNDTEGAKVDFGILETFQKNPSALKHLKRFDIISTYYPNDYSDGALKSGATKKIKRVIALPGESFKIENGLLTVNGKSVDYPCKIESTTKKDTERTLGENEYWVLGDNRDHSTDSGDYGPIHKENMVGRLVAIEGQAKLKFKNYLCDNPNCGKTTNQAGTTCSYCHVGKLVKQFDLKDKEYKWPRYY